MTHQNNPVDKNKLNGYLQIDTPYSELESSIMQFTGVIGKTITGTIVGAKPRFSAGTPRHHCELVLLSVDNYLIGYIDEFNLGADKLKFVVNDCPIDYVDHIDGDKDLEFFPIEANIIARKGRKI